MNSEQYLFGRFHYVLAFRRSETWFPSFLVFAAGIVDLFIPCPNTRTPIHFLSPTRRSLYYIPFGHPERGRCVYPSNILDHTGHYIFLVNLNHTRTCPLVLIIAWNTKSLIWIHEGVKLDNFKFGATIRSTLRSAWEIRVDKLANKISESIQGPSRKSYLSKRTRICLFQEGISDFKILHSTTISRYGLPREFPNNVFERNLEIWNFQIMSMNEIWKYGISK